MRPPRDLGQILRSHWPDLKASNYQPYQLRALSALRDCRTSALGGHVDACGSCGDTRLSYNSCRSRFCPKCQGVEKEAWMMARRAELLPVTYYHVVFTLPHELNTLCLGYPKAIYDLLFESAWATLDTFGKDKKWLGGRTAASMVLHTWGQNLGLHPHVHCIVPSGGMVGKGANLTWQRPRKGNALFLYPVAAMSSVFRGIYLKGLERLLSDGLVRLPVAVNLSSLRQTLYSKPWVVYAKRPFGGPEQVIEYLGRYTHKVAISNHRIQGVTDTSVTFEYKDYKAGGAKKLMTLEKGEFVRRFAQHILPLGFRRLRHFGFLGNACKANLLAMARHFFGVAAEPKPTRKELRTLAAEQLLGHGINVCRCCGAKNLITVGILPASRAPPNTENDWNKVLWL